MKCQICQKEFKSKRTDTKFCSSNCRVTHNRNKGVTDNPVTDKSVTDNPVTDKSVTDNPVSVVTDNVKIKIVPKDKWRREHLEKHYEFFNNRLKETEGCDLCRIIREQFESDFMFCGIHLKFPKPI